MATDPLPLQVVILEDDPLARVSVEQLLGRDLRTEVMAAFDRPGRLLNWMKDRHGWQLPHVFVIDAEYESEPALPDLLARLNDRANGRSVLLLSQYGGEELVRIAARADAAGVVLKKDIGLAVATAVYLARTDAPVYSSALDPLLETMAVEPAVRRWWHAGRSLPRWRLLRGLSPRQEEVAWHCLIFGMSAQLTGEEIELAKGSVEKYRTHLYDKIEKLAPRRLDWDPLQPVMHRLYRTRPDDGPNGCEESDYESIYVGDEWAFHLLTQLPRREEALQKR